MLRAWFGTLLTSVLFRAPVTKAIVGCVSHDVMMADERHKHHGMFVHPGDAMLLAFSDSLCLA